MNTNDIGADEFDDGIEEAELVPCAVCKEDHRVTDDGAVYAAVFDPKLPPGPDECGGYPGEEWLFFCSRLCTMRAFLSNRFAGKNVVARCGEYTVGLQRVVNGVTFCDVCSPGRRSLDDDQNLDGDDGDDDGK